MSTIVAAIKRFIDDEDGVTAIEYGLIAACIATALAAGATLVAGGLTTVFTNIKAVLVPGP